MSVLLLLCMSYLLVGEQAHEWIGCGLFALFILHHILNRSWWCRLRHGKYKTMRIVQTVTNMLVLIGVLGSMCSSVILSRYVFRVQVDGLSVFARTVHILSAYWGFLFLSVHLGLHWGMLRAQIKSSKLQVKQAVWSTWILRVGTLFVACYGAVCMVRHNLFEYMFLKNQFVFFDTARGIIWFLLDYVAIMFFLAWLTYSLQTVFMYCRQKIKNKND